MLLELPEAQVAYDHKVSNGCSDHQVNTDPVSVINVAGCCSHARTAQGSHCQEDMLVNCSAKSFQTSKVVEGQLGVVGSCAVLDLQPQMRLKHMRCKLQLMQVQVSADMGVRSCENTHDRYAPATCYCLAELVQLNKAILCEQRQVHSTASLLCNSMQQGSWLHNKSQAAWQQIRKQRPKGQEAIASITASALCISV